jgi:hypothetical protein
MLHPDLGSSRGIPPLQRAQGWATRPMNTTFIAGFLSILLGGSVFCQTMPRQTQLAPEANPSLEQRVLHFEMIEAALIDGIAELSSNSIPKLHLGIEEISREKLSDPRERSIRFSLRLENKTVKEILDTLCQFDARYAWSTDGDSINVYPRSGVDDNSNLLNLRLEHISLENIPDPDQALTPLARQFPTQQIGYIQMGGDNTYSKPWTVSLEHLTVRQFVNRIAEHMGSQTSWIWQGGKDARMFTFLKGGFHTEVDKRRN